MNQLIRHLTSLRNLTRANASGQVATLLILLLLVVLMFVLVTVNIGNVSLNATKLANAADGASLQLASQLATKSRMMFEGLGNTYEKCKKRGFWSIILAVVLAIVAVVVTILTWGTAGMAMWIIVAGAIGGTIGGVVGAAIDGTSLARGALTGFVIGLAIGSIASGIAGATTGGGYEWAVSYAVSDVGESVLVATTPITMGAGTVALGALSLASEVYMSVVRYQGVANIMEQLQKDMARLSEQDRFRESAFFTALSQTVDNPNKVADEDDINGNGDRSETLPHFYVWWHKRMVNFASLSNAYLGPVNDFLAAMQNFVNFAQTTYSGSPGMLEKKDYMWTVDGEGMEFAVPGTDDGVIVGLLRPLYEASSAYRTTHWSPGPTPDAMNAYTDVDCCSGDEPSCSYPPCPNPPAGFDDLDDLAENLRNGVYFMQGLLDQYGVASAWQSWIYFFYDFDSLMPGYTGTPDTENFYNYLQEYIDMLESLKSEILDIRDNRLNACNVGCLNDTNECVVCPEGAGHWEPWWFYWVWVPDGNCLMSPPTPPYPCRLSSGGGTIDANLDDEFQPALDAIDTLIAEFTNFRSAIENWTQEMLQVLNSIAYQYGGLNPVSYEWDDARGHNMIQVEAGPFVMPRYKTKKSWSKVCIRLIYHTDNYDGQDRCWIRVSRFEPNVVAIGPLGSWNPFNRGITKISKAYYGVNRVGIKGTTR